MILNRTAKGTFWLLLEINQSQSSEETKRTQANDLESKDILNSFKGKPIMEAPDQNSIGKFIKESNPKINDLKKRYFTL